MQPQNHHAACSAQLGSLLDIASSMEDSHFVVEPHEIPVLVRGNEAHSISTHTNAGGNHPQEWIGPETLLNVVTRPTIPRMDILLAPGRAATLFHELDGGKVLEEKIRVECDESTQSNTEQCAIEPTEHDEERGRAEIQNIFGSHRSQEVEERSRRNPEEDDQCISDEQVEILVVVVSDTIVDPRAVVVHLQHAPLAHATVMAAIGLHFDTLPAPSSTAIVLLLDRTSLCILSERFVFLIVDHHNFRWHVHALAFHLKSSIPFWHSSRIDCDAHGEAPDEQEHEDVVQHQANHTEHGPGCLILEKNFAVYEDVNVIGPCDDPSHDHWRHEVDDSQQQIVS